ncbi:UNVERIFIED_CONTAM: hypothetical protein FKN15_061302 [Acipenser sinensis]
MADKTGIRIPSRLPLLLTHEGVLLPGCTMRISVDTYRNMQLVKSRLLRGTSLKSTIIGVIPNTRDPEHDTDELPALHRVGTAGIAVQVVGSNWPKPHYTLLITGLCRFRTLQLLKERPFAVGELVDMLDMSVPVVAKLRRLLDSLPKETLPDMLASMIRMSNSEKLQIEGLKLLQKTRKPRQDEDKTVVAIRPIRKIGQHFPGGQFSLDTAEEEEEEDEDSDDIALLEKKIRSASMPEPALKVCVKEIKRYASMPEYALTRNYLELMVELPWNKSTTDCLDIHAARVLLDSDHYAMEKLKKRVLEYLAVRQLKNNLKGPILCFVGPPGVGKTSVGRSIAKTLGREFHRIALGGVCDQSDIRGHRRTYVGSMPGRIINGLKVVGVANPVFLLDEVDKLGKSLQGDPAAALLECIPVLYCCPNPTLTGSSPLRRYTREAGVRALERKFGAICRAVAVKVAEGNKVTKTDPPPEPEAAGRYTREAGVRALERKFGAICRAVAVKVAEGNKVTKTDPPPEPEAAGRREKVLESLNSPADLSLPPEMPIVMDRHALKDILGPPIFEMQVSERLSQPGVAIGLAWTPMGGEIMFVEASRMEGEGQLTLTGQLGDVMKESAHLAISWLRSNAKTYHLTNASGSFDLLDNTDIHLHFPAGAVTKDGPSAGVTIVTCLASLFSGRLVRSDLAMTGEITLRGLVLPVGGIKDKALAAHRAGLKQIIIPKRNEKDLEEIPATVRADLDFVMAGCLDEVLNAAFDGGFPATSRHDLLNSKL